MVRRAREDRPGSWHHVINRGIAKRPLFENRDDIRYFLSRIAREVRARRIEVHAFSVLTSHFHFLVRSPVGEMSEAFRRAQNAHSRRFNRSRRRDGALVRGRFFSKPVHDDRYRRVLVRYIDHNPVKARVVDRAPDYAFGSARWYVQPEAPPWLKRDWVVSEACRITEASAFTPDVYRRAFTSIGRSGVELVERRLESRASAEPLEDLIGSTPEAVGEWMQRKAQLADGHRPGLPVCTFGALDDALAQDEADNGEWVVRIKEQMRSGRDIAIVGLGRALAGHSFAELSERTGRTVMPLRRLAELHRRLVMTDGAYLERSSAVGQIALEAVLGTAPQGIPPSIRGSNAGSAFG